MSIRRLHEGALAGLAGGAVGAAWALLASPILGTDPLAETRLAAVPLLGDAATEPGRATLAFLVGGASHLAVSAAWGVVFSLACRAYSPAGLLAAAVPFGVAVWLVMHHVLLPALGVAWIVAEFSPARAIAEHVVYGVGVALGLLVQRRRRG